MNDGVSNNDVSGVELQRDVSRYAEKVARLGAGFCEGTAEFVRHCERIATGTTGGQADEE